MGDDTIKVAVRVRPQIKRELSEGAKEYWKVKENEIYLNDDFEGRTPESYLFDYIFNTDKTNSDVYEIVKPIVQSAIEGINGTVFAYGQTSSGKTHSIMGSENDLGIIPRAIDDIFKHISESHERKFLVRSSFVEIYLEKIKDLLDIDKKEPVKIREDFFGTISMNCAETITRSGKELLDVVKQGNKHRQVGETNMNERSSRSHVIFKIIIESSSISENSEDDDPVKVSHLYFIDLAGSERVAQTKATGTRLKEGGNINKSLSALSLVIRQLGESQGGQTTHVNFRDSKLTRMLSNALGGNSKTLIIATITPVSIEDSQSTLLFAKCAKKVKNKPTVNEILTEAALIKKYKMKEKELLSELEAEKMKNITLQADQENKDVKIRDLTSQLQKLRFDYVAEKPAVVLKRRHTLGIDKPATYIDVSPRDIAASLNMPLLRIPEEVPSEEVPHYRMSTPELVGIDKPASNIDVSPSGEVASAFDAPLLEIPENVASEEAAQDRMSTPEPVMNVSTNSTVSTPKEVLKSQLHFLHKDYELNEFCLLETVVDKEQMVDDLASELNEIKNQLINEKQKTSEAYETIANMQLEIERLKTQKGDEASKLDDVDLPVDDLPVHDLPVDVLPVDLPVDDLPVDLSVHDLPVDDLPVHDLPVDDLPVHDLTMKINDLMDQLQTEKQRATDALENMVKMQAENEAYTIQNAELLISNDLLTNKFKRREEELLSLLEETRQTKQSKLEYSPQWSETAVSPISSEVIQHSPEIVNTNYLSCLKEIEDLKSVLNALKVEALELRTENEDLRKRLDLPDLVEPVVPPIDINEADNIPEVMKTQDTGMRKSLSDTYIYNNDLATTRPFKTSSLPNLRNVHRNSSGEIVVELKEAIFSLQTLLSVETETKDGNGQHIGDSKKETPIEGNITMTEGNYKKELEEAIKKINMLELKVKEMEGNVQSEDKFEMERNFEIERKNYDLKIKSLEDKYSKDLEESESQISKLKLDLKNAVDCCNSQIRALQEKNSQDIEQSQTELKNLELQVEQARLDYDDKIKVIEEKYVNDLSDSKNVIATLELEMSQAKNSYECKIKSLEERFAEDLKELNHMKMQLEQKSIDYDAEIKSREEKYSKELELIQTMLSESELKLEQERNEYLAKMTSLGEKACKDLENSEAEINRLETQIRNDRNNYESQFNYYESMKEKYTQEIAKMQMLLDEAELQLKQDRRKYESKIRSVEKELEDSRATIYRLEMEMEHVEDDNKSKITAMEEKYLKDLSILKSELQVKQGKKPDVEITLLEQQIQIMEGDINSLNNLLEKRDTNIKNLQDKYDELLNLYEDQKLTNVSPLRTPVNIKDLEIARKKLKDAESEIMKLQQSNIELENLLQLKESELLDIQNAIAIKAETISENNEYSSLIELPEEENTNLITEEQMRDCKAELIISNNKYEEAKTEISSLKEEMIPLKMELADVNQKYEDVLTDLEIQTEQVICLTKKIEEIENKSNSLDLKEKLTLTSQKYLYEHISNVYRNLLIVKEDHIDGLYGQADYFSLMKLIKNLLDLTSSESDNTDLSRDLVNYNLYKINSLRSELKIIQKHFKMNILNVEGTASDIKKIHRYLTMNTPEILHVKETFETSLSNFQLIKKTISDLPVITDFSETTHFDSYDQFTSVFDKLQEHIKKLVEEMELYYKCVNNLFEQHVDFVTILVDSQRITDLIDIDKETFIQSSDEIDFTYKNIYEPISILKCNEKLQLELAKIERLKKPFSKEDYSYMLSIKFERDRLRKELESLKEPKQEASKPEDERSSKLKTFKGTVKARRDSLHDLKRGKDFSSISSDDCGDCAILQADKELLEAENKRLKLWNEDLERMLKDSETSITHLQDRLKINTDDRVYLEDTVNLYSDQLNELINENSLLKMESANTTIDVQSTISEEHKKMDLLKKEVALLKAENLQLSEKMLHALKKLEEKQPHTADCVKCYTLKTKLEVLDLEIARLKEELKIQVECEERHNEENTELKDKIDHLTAQNNSLMVEIKAIKKLNKNDQEQINVNEDKIAQLEERIVKLKAVISNAPELGYEDADIPQNLDMLKLKYTQLLAHVALLQNNNDTLNLELERSTNELRTLRNSELSAKIQLQGKESQCKEMEEKMSQLVDLINNHNSDITKLQDEIIELEATIERKDIEISSLTKNIESSFERIEALEKQIKDHEEQEKMRSKDAGKIEDKLERNAVEIKRLSSLHLEYAKEIVLLKEEIAAEIEKRQELEIEIAALKESNEHLDMEVVGSLAEIDSLRLINQDYKDEIKEYIKKIAELEAQLLSPSSEVVIGEVIQTDTQVEINILKDKVAELTRKNSKLADEHDSLLSKFKETKEKINQLQNQESVYRNSLENNVKISRDLQIQISNLEEENEKLILEKETADKRINDLSEELEVQKSDNYTLNLEVLCSLEEHKSNLKRLEEHKEKHAVNDKKISDLKSKLSTAAREIEHLSETIHILKGKIKVFESLKNEYSTDTEKLSKHIESLKKTVVQQKETIKRRDDQLSRLEATNVELTEAINTLPDKCCISCEHLEQKLIMEKHKIVSLEKRIYEISRTDHSIMTEMTAQNFQNERINAVTFADVLSFLMEKVKGHGHDRCATCIKVHGVIKHFTSKIQSLKNSHTHWNQKLTLDLCDLIETEYHCSDLLKITAAIPEQIDEDALQILVDLNSNVTRKIQRTQQMKTYVATCQKYLVDVAKEFKEMEDDVRKIKHALMEPVSVFQGGKGCSLKPLNRAMCSLILKVSEYLSLVIDVYKPNVESMEPLECYQILLKMHGIQINELEDEIMKIVDPTQLNVFLKYKDVLTKYNFAKVICDVRSDKIKLLDLKVNRICSQSTFESASTASLVTAQVARAVEETESADSLVTAVTTQETEYEPAVCPSGTTMLTDSSVTAVTAQETEYDPAVCPSGTTMLTAISSVDSSISNESPRSSDSTLSHVESGSSSTAYTKRTEKK